MPSDSDSFWETVQRLESTSGPAVALGFIFFFAIIYFGIAFLAAWAVSVTLGTSYWMTLLSIVALKFALK
jgi:hypothetical protein